MVRPSGQMVYVRNFTAPLFEQPRINVVVGVDPRRKLKERERREVALRELEGTVSDERREVLKGSLRGLLTKTRGRRGSWWAGRRWRRRRCGMGGPSCSARTSR